GGPLGLPEGRDLSRPVRIERTDLFVRDLDRVVRVQAEEPGGLRMELGGLCLEQWEREFLREVDDREAWREDRGEGAGRRDVPRMEGDETRPAGPPRPLEREDASRRFALCEDLVVRLLKHGPTSPRFRRDRSPTSRGRARGLRFDGGTWTFDAGEPEKGYRG